MNLMTFMRGAAVSVLAMGAGAAAAQGCDIVEFGSENGALYLEAENEMLANDDIPAALAALNRLRANDLNCYEEGAALGLSANIKIANDDYLGAATDLRTSLDKGYVTGDAAKNLLRSLYQIYFSEDQYEEGLQFVQRWLDAGGAPNRDEKWTYAVVYNNLERYAEALPWAEQVFATDGDDAASVVYDFLILLYDKTGQPAKKAALLETLLARDPTNRRLWDAVSGDYARADNYRKAFEVQKAMYLGGILTTEEELERVVQFYNQFDVPYQAGRILEKEMNAGRITKSYDNLELLANLYQVAREHERAIPVIREAAALSSNGAMYERLGRSHADLQQWQESEDALVRALDAGGLKDRGLAWVQIGQSRYERDDRAGAREAFRNANDRAGRSWLGFMDSEEQTAKALVVFEASNKVQEIENEDKVCKKLQVLGDAPETCTSLQTRLEEAQATLAAAQAS